MPLEDSWMRGAYPKEVTDKMPWALGEYELRYITTPDRFKGMQPLWVNGRVLSTAEFDGSSLHCGDASFNALYVDVEYMEYSSVESILRLAKSGLPVFVGRVPKEPGVNKTPGYQAALDELLSLPSVSSDPSVIPGKPLIEGENLPDFWCRQDGETYYIFVANPMSMEVSYPMEYRFAFSDKGSIREIILNHHGKSDSMTLEFSPMESILLKVTPRKVEKIDLGYRP